jgi:phosphonate transport system substrate-binding protein
MRTLCLGLAMMMFGCATPSVPMSRLVVGIQATKADETRAAWAPLVQDFGRVLAVPSDVFAAPQAEVVKALQDRRIDVAWLSSSVAIDAVVESQAEVFAVYRNLNGSEGYRSVLVVRRDSGISTLEQALTPGKYRYASGPGTSTSGYLLPQHFLFAPRGTSAEASFKAVQYGGHFPNLDALWSGAVDVAINNSTDLAAFRLRQPAADMGLAVLWESPMVPNDVLLVRPGLSAAAKQRIRETVLAYGRDSQQQRELLRQASSIATFIPADTRLLVPVASFKFATERAAVAKDGRLTPAEQSARLLDVARREDAFNHAVASIK